MVTGVADLAVWAGKHTTIYAAMNPQGFAEQLQKDKQMIKSLGNLAKKGGIWVYRNSSVNLLLDPDDYIATQSENAVMMDKLYEKAKSMDAEDWGELTGQIGFEFLQDALKAGAGAALTAAKVADKTIDVARIVDKAHDLDNALDAAKAIDKVDDATDAVKVAEELGEVKYLEEVGEVLDDVPPPPRIEPPSYNQLKNTPPCFLAGTQVKTPDGELAIEELTLENTVLVYDFKEKCIKEKRILKLYNNWTYRYFEIQTKDNTPILATSKHLFWVENYNKWIPAKELTVGMELKDANNSTNSILSINIISNVDVPTYNFEVEDIHNYFVGQFGLLVHNSNEPSLFESTASRPTKIYTVTDVNTGKVVYVG